MDFEAAQKMLSQQWSAIKGAELRAAIVWEVLSLVMGWNTSRVMELAILPKCV